MSPIEIAEDGYFRFLCPKCQARIKARPSDAGKNARCQKCGQQLLIPAPSPAQQVHLVSRARGPFKSKILASAIGLAVLLAAFLAHALPGALKVAGRAGSRLFSDRDIRKSLPTNTLTPLEGILIGVAAVILLFLLCYFWQKFWERVKTRSELLAQALKAPSGDDIIERDVRPPILYLRSFADDSTPYPDHEKELVAAFSLFGPVIAIGRPGESLQTLGAARVYPGDDWQLQIHQWIERCALVVIRIGASPGLRWEIDTVATCLKADKLLLQVPQATSPGAAVLVNRMVRRITHKNQEHDFADVTYIFFDKASRPHFIKGPLAIPKISATDENSTQLRHLYGQAFPDAFGSYCAEKKAAAEARKRKSVLVTYISIVTIILGVLFLACGGFTIPMGIASLRDTRNFATEDTFGKGCVFWGAMGFIWGGLTILGGIGALRRRRWGRVLCLINCLLAVTMGLLFLLFTAFQSGGLRDFGFGVSSICFVYAASAYIIMRLPSARREFSQRVG